MYSGVDELGPVFLNLWYVERLQMACACVIGLVIKRYIFDKNN